MNILLKYGKYTFEGWVDCVLYSYENGVSEGDVRQVGKRLVYAHCVERKLFRKNKVKWCLVGVIDYVDIVKYKSELFG